MNLVLKSGAFLIVADQTVDFKTHIQLFEGTTLQDIKMCPFRENLSLLQLDSLK